MGRSRGVDVIVPVYRGLQQTRACIESVLQSGLGAEDRLIVIDDASPDPEVTAYVRSLSDTPQVLALANDTNLGFVGTVNRGMALDGTRDVVLLNSDTRVANDWLARLRACAYSANDVATVTPFSNAGTICSYPFEGWTGGVPGTLGLTGLDRLFASTLAGAQCELPTAVGFCMYIRRRALDETGLFDAARFGRGYGEENDFCLRAIERGWRHLLAADTFVFHEGSVSFGADREALQARGHERLLERHPDYLERVRAFIARDPVSRLRDRIDRARCAVGAREEACVLRERGVLPEDFAWPEPSDDATDTRPVQLHIAHGWGGGIQRWLDDFHAADPTHRNLVLHSVSHRNAAGFRLELREPGRDTPLAVHNLQVPIRACASDHPEYRQLLALTIAQTGATRLVVSSLIGHGLDALDSGLPTAWVLHDLFPFCPALFAYHDRACTRCDLAELSPCLAKNPLNVFWHNTTPDDWLRLRAGLAERLRQGRIEVIAPSPSVIERWARLLPDLVPGRCRVVPHGIDRAVLGPPCPPVTDDATKLRLIVPGRLAPHKGLDLLLSALPELAPQAELLLLGCGDFGEGFEGQPGVRVIRHYEAATLGDLVRAFAPDAALLLSTVPESFSYTLSEMFALGLPVVATRGGAFEERIAEGRTGHLIDVSAASLVACVNRLTRPALRAMRDAVRALPVVDRHDSAAAILAALPPSPARAPAFPFPRPDQGQRHLIREFDRGLRNTIRLEAAVHHERGTLALRDAEIASLRRRLDLAEGRSVAADDSPATHPRVSVLRAERAAIRARIRFWLGLPDRARICLHPGEPDSGDAVARLLHAATRLTEARNDTFVVITRSSGEGPVWHGHRATCARLRSLRRLHFVPRAPEDASWMLGSDLLLQASEAAARQFAPMARDAALASWNLSDPAAPTDQALAQTLALLDQLPPASRGLNL